MKCESIHHMGMGLFLYPSFTVPHRLYRMQKHSIPFLRNVETSGTIVEKQVGYTEKVLSAGCYRQLGRYRDFRY